MRDLCLGCRDTWQFAHRALLILSPAFGSVTPFPMPHRGTRTPGTFFFLLPPLSHLSSSSSSLSPPPSVLEFHTDYLPGISMPLICCSTCLDYLFPT